MSPPSPLPSFLGIGAPRAGTTWLQSETLREIYATDLVELQDLSGLNIERWLP